METRQIKDLVMSWGTRFVTKDFNEEHMKLDMSLLGLDSIDVVEFCELLEEKVGIYVDFEWVMDCSNLNELVDKVKAEMAQEVSAL
ncbi:acyl carrier protein [Pseudoalteromonas sp. T1lg23B]|uniref:acyl carrier protein n=1 Tax=Pseudoalteromonas sp. T1lg23B TaxID=2077097 RepID=UPI000CF6A3E0|nr:acyl carrier protein [Pseudoalteromonas sp. T1lg23B]